MHEPLLDCMQSLVMAQLFAWMEGLFALGYRPKLQAQIRERVEEKERQNQSSSSASEPLLTSPAATAQ